MIGIAERSSTHLPDDESVRTYVRAKLVREAEEELNKAIKLAQTINVGFSIGIDVTWDDGVKR